MKPRLHLVDGREYEVIAGLVQAVALFDREHLVFVCGALKLSVSEVQQVRERTRIYEKARARKWHPVDCCFLAPRRSREVEAERARARTENGKALSKMAVRLERYLLTNSGRTAQQCCDAIGCHRYSAQRALNELKSQGLSVRERLRNPLGRGIIDLWYHITSVPAPTVSVGRRA